MPWGKLQTVFDAKTSEFAKAVTQSLLHPTKTTDVFVTGTGSSRCKPYIIFLGSGLGIRRFRSSKKIAPAKIVATITSSKQFRPENKSIRQ